MQLAINRLILLSLSFPFPSFAAVTFQDLAFSKVWSSIKHLALSRASAFMLALQRVYDSLNLVMDPSFLSLAHLSSCPSVSVCLPENHDAVCLRAQFRYANMIEGHRLYLFTYR